MILSQHGAVTTIAVENLEVGWSKEILLTSDWHFDSVQCNRDLLKEHLEEVIRRDAWLMVFGDIVDAMQGKFDPRRNMDELRPEYRSSEYFDVVIDDLSAYLKPYKNNLVLLADGNHETSILKNAQINLTKRLVKNLRADGSSVVHGGFGGWVLLKLYHGDSWSRAIKVKYFHGSGGEAPVTRGAIQTNRQAVYLPDADIIVNGHSHNNYIIPISRERLTNQGRHYFDMAWHIRTPGYKQGYADGTGGWEVERGGVPKPIGSVWCKLEFQTFNGLDGTKQNRLVIIPTADVRGPEVCTPAGGGYDGPTWDEDDCRQE